MPERPPEFLDVDEDEPELIDTDSEIDPDNDSDEALPAAPDEEALEDDEDEEDNGDGDDVIGRAAAVLKYIVEHIVDDPSQIAIGATSDDRGPVLLLSVAEDDRGKIIGRQGRIVQAIRTIVKAATVGTGERVNVEIVD
ncbi:MAG: KH domain-containing protein [Candidatus Eremiobacteraeota bacterium]|nr:KH domain-containing protein [Candidatus Eremiobacteraeota bacterium]